MALLLTLVVAYIIYVVITVDEDCLFQEDSDRNFEKRLRKVSKAAGQDDVTYLARTLKNGFNHYYDNPKALSTLRVLEHGVQNGDKDILYFLANTNKIK